MKKLLMVLTLLSITACQTTKTDSVGNADDKNQNRTETVSSLDAHFLVEAADARMMDSAEGKLATEKGSSKKVKAYGQLMVNDQADLLLKIKNLADKNHLALPDKISDEKQKALDELSQLKGKKFDKQFLTMIQRDHERDVNEFSKVEAQPQFDGDKDVVAFAKDSLPLIQSHLAKVKKIRKKM